MIADYYNKGTAVEPMPAELKSLLSIQKASSSVPQLFPAAAAAGVHLYYIHGSGAQSFYPDKEQAAYATVDTAGQQYSTVGARVVQQPYNRSFCLAPALIDHRAPSSAASSLTAGQPVYTDEDLEDDEAFAYTTLAVQEVKARWNSPI
jgi:hypothetical protein